MPFPPTHPYSLILSSISWWKRASGPPGHMYSQTQKVVTTDEDDGGKEYELGERNNSWAWKTFQWTTYGWQKEEGSKEREREREEIVSLSLRVCETLWEEKKRKRPQHARLSDSLTHSVVMHLSHLKQLDRMRGGRRKYQRVSERECKYKRKKRERERKKWRSKRKNERLFSFTRVREEVREGKRNIQSELQRVCRYLCSLPCALE